MAKTMKIKMMGVVEANSYGDISVDECELRGFIAQQLGLREPRDEGGERPFQKRQFAGEVSVEITDLTVEPKYASDFVTTESEADC